MSSEKQSSRKAGRGLWQAVEVAVRFALGILCHIFHRELSENTVNTCLQFVKFGIVGVSNTLLSYLLYTGALILFRILGWFGRADYLLAQVVAFILSVAWSYYWNNKMVFKLGEGETRSVWKSLLKTYISYSFTGLFLNTFLLILWVRIIGISEFIAPLINLLISVPLNFVINKFWAFKKE